MSPGSVSGSCTASRRAQIRTKTLHPDDTGLSGRSTIGAAPETNARHVLNTQRIGENAADYDLGTSRDRAIGARSGVRTEGLGRSGAIQHQRRVDTIRVTDQPEQGFGGAIGLQVKQIVRRRNGADPVQSRPDREELALCVETMAVIRRWRRRVEYNMGSAYGARSWDKRATGHAPPGSFVPTPQGTFWGGPLATRYVSEGNQLDRNASLVNRVGEGPGS